MGKSLDKLNELAAGQMSSWHEEAQWSRKNGDWLKRSSKIAFRILSELDRKGLSQKELAAKMGVSPQYVNKIVKGKENLSLETISKIEEALEISLVSINSYTYYTYADTPPVDSFSRQIHLSETRSSTISDDYVSYKDSQTNKNDAA